MMYDLSDLGFKWFWFKTYVTEFELFKIAKNIWCFDKLTDKVKNYTVKLN